MTKERGLGHWGWRAIVAVALWGGYMGLVGKPSGSEAVAGALASAAAIAMLLYLEATAGLRFRFKAAWWLDVAKLPATIVVDAWLVSVALLKHLVGLGPLEGRFMAIPIPASPDDGADEARLALCIIGTSVSPNAYVLDVDRERRLILVHELVWRTDRPPTETLWWPR